MFQHLEEAQTLSFCYKSVSPCGPSGQATPHHPVLLSPASAQRFGLASAVRLCSGRKLATETVPKPQGTAPLAPPPAASPM